jgi:hypothetical protein
MWRSRSASGLVPRCFYPGACRGGPIRRQRDDLELLPVGCGAGSVGASSLPRYLEEDGLQSQVPVIKTNPLCSLSRAAVFVPTQGRGALSPSDVHPVHEDQQMPTLKNTVDIQVSAEQTS